MCRPLHVAVVLTRGRLSNSTERASLVVKTPSNIAIVVANVEAHSTKARMLVKKPNLTWCHCYRRGLVVEQATHKWPRCDVYATPYSIIRMLVKNEIGIRWRKQHEKDSDNDSGSVDEHRHVERRSATRKISRVSRCIMWRGAVALFRASRSSAEHLNTERDGFFEVHRYSKLSLQPPNTLNSQKCVSSKLFLSGYEICCTSDTVQL